MGRMINKSLPRNVLVTGAAGFIGSHVVDRLLSEGLRVTGLDNFDPFYDRRIKESNLEGALSHPAFQFAEGDLRDEVFLAGVFATERFDVVVHLAAKAGVRPSIDAPGEYYDSNVMGTVRLLETMRRFGVPALVFGSSSSVYGERSSGAAFREDDAADLPVSPYAATKRACELLCHTYAHLHGVRCLALRLFTVFGPRQRPDLAIHKFTRAISSGQSIPQYGDGSSVRDYTYVDDVVEAVCRSIDHVLEEEGQPFEVINIGGGRTVKLAELVRLLGETLGSAPKIDRKPAQPGDVPRTEADIDRARELIGWEPGVKFEEGLRRFAAWYSETNASTVERVVLTRAPH